MKSTKQNRRRSRLLHRLRPFFRKLWLGWDFYLPLAGYLAVFGLGGLIILNAGSTVEFLYRASGSGVGPGEFDWAPPQSDLIYRFGTDGLGRPALPRALLAGSFSLWSGLFATVTGLAAGLMLASIPVLTGYGRSFRFLVSLTDTFHCIPAILIVLILATGLGGGFWMTVFLFAGVIAFFTAGRIAQWFYGFELEGDVIAARGLGFSRIRLLRENLLPRVGPRLATLAAGMLPAVILAEAALNFIGFGGTFRTPGLGRLIYEGRTVMFEAPWLLFWPGMLLWIILVVLGMFAWSVRRTTDEGSFDRVF